MTESLRNQLHVTFYRILVLRNMLHL